MITTRAYFTNVDRNSVLNVLLLCSDQRFYEDFRHLGFPAKSELVRVYTDAFHCNVGNVDAVFLISEHDFPVGCAVVEKTIFGTNDNPVYEVNVYIGEDFRYEGFGSTLMEEVRKHYPHLIGNMHNEESTRFFMKHDVETNSIYGSYGLKPSVKKALELKNRIFESNPVMEMTA
jgi:hypothetical protein